MRFKSVELIIILGFQSAAFIPINEAIAGVVSSDNFGKSTISKDWQSLLESGEIKAR